MAHNLGQPCRSDEPLRLKSGRQLASGKYVDALQAKDRHGHAVSYQLDPPTEIPPRTEVVVAARSSGGRGSAGRGVKGVSDPPEHLLTSFHTIINV